MTKKRELPEIYICIPYTTETEKYQRVKAAMLQRYYQDKGFMVINPFELMDQLERVHHTLVKHDPTVEEYHRERMNNIESCTDMLLCCGWEQYPHCVEEMEFATARGLKFRYEKKKNPNVSEV